MRPGEPTRVRHGVIEFRLYGRIYRFRTASGMFSHRAVDEGTGILLESLIRRFGRTDMKGASLLDLGCGYGVLGIVLADILHPAEVVMVDVDRRCVAAARRNARENRVGGIRVLRSDVCAALDPERDRFDMVVTNPPIKSGKATVLRFIDEARSHLVPGGEFWAVIMTRHGARQYVRYMNRTFSGCEVAERQSGYRILRGWVDG